MNIKLQRSQSLLQELLTEALSTLSNPLLNTLNITEVVCSRGKYHAEVLLEASDYSKEEQAQILKEIKKAQWILKDYVLSSSGWFKCPNFSFKFDDSLQKANALDKIFAQIAKKETK